MRTERGHVGLLCGGEGSKRPVAKALERNFILLPLFFEFNFPLSRGGEKGRSNWEWVERGGGVRWGGTAHHPMRVREGREGSTHRAGPNPIPVPFLDCSPRQGTWSALQGERRITVGPEKHGRRNDTAGRAAPESTHDVTRHCAEGLRPPPRPARGAEIDVDRLITLETGRARRAARLRCDASARPRGTSMATEGVAKGAGRGSREAQGAPRAQ